MHKHLLFLTLSKWCLNILKADLFDNLIISLENLNLTLVAYIDLVMELSGCYTITTKMRVLLLHIEKI
jgi:hypothetical protein